MADLNNVAAVEVLEKPVELASNQIQVGKKIVSFLKTPTSYYLDMQTKAQGGNGKILLKKYAEEVLKRTVEGYRVDDFTPDEINLIMEGFDTFCNTQRN